MTLDGISTQTPSLPAQPPAPRSAPPPPLYAGLEEIKNLRVENVPQFTGDVAELNTGRIQQNIGTNQLSATSKQGTFIDVAVNTSTPPVLSPAWSAQQAEEVAPPSFAPSYSVSLTREDGNTLSIDFTQNVRIHEEKNGTTVYFSDTNKRQIQVASATPSRLNEKARWDSPLASPSNQRLRDVWAMHTLPEKNGITFIKP